MAETITHGGITVPESRWYRFNIFGVMHIRGRDCNIGENAISIDTWDPNVVSKWERVEGAVNRWIDQMLPQGEDKISIQCVYSDWDKAERCKAWTVKEWRAMITKVGQTELFVVG